MKGGTEGGICDHIIVHKRWGGKEKKAQFTEGKVSGWGKVKGGGGCPPICGRQMS